MNGRNGALENGVCYAGDSGAGGNEFNGPQEHGLRSLFPADPLSLSANAESRGMPSSLRLGPFSSNPLHLPRIGSGVGVMPSNVDYATASYLMSHQRLLLEEQLRRDLLTEQILRSTQLRYPLLSTRESIRPKADVKDTPIHVALRSKIKHGSERKSNGRMRLLQSVMLKRKTATAADRAARRVSAVSKFPLPSATRRTPVTVSKLPEFQSVWEHMQEAFKDSGMDDSKKSAYVKERFSRRIGGWSRAAGASEASATAAGGRPSSDDHSGNSQPTSPMKGIIFKRKRSELASGPQEI
jgi:hypothetical protein